VNVEPIACLTDNFAYLVGRDGAREALVVDPSEAIPVLQALEHHGLGLAGILCTHHHYDHVGGVKELCLRFPGIPVYASDHDASRIEGVTEGMADGASFSAIGFSIECLKVPGHTLGALAYYVGDAVFTGDTLFGAGCGRLFEGTPAQMHASLMRLAALPVETKVYFGHEYTRSNLAFARSIEPENAATQTRCERAAAPKNSATTPSLLEEERATNPFLRCSEPSVRASLGEAFVHASDVEVFAEIRRRKDTFRA
jgi:hydroxyacylglutathione hydrolase